MASPIIVTGAAGFIGFHVAKTLIKQGLSVIGIDNFTPFYDPALKTARWAVLQNHPLFLGKKLDLSENEKVRELFETSQPDHVIHLAAQPGVRYSIEAPFPYITANITAFLNILEGCRFHPVKHLIYASSSSVYGLNTSLPFSEEDAIQQPTSLYAATKIADEAMASAYSHLYAIPASGLRFFTVYGPWGRPDMSVYAFTDAIAQGKPISVANSGKVWRDFTYIDDIVEGIIRLLDKPPTASLSQENTPSTEHNLLHRVYNIGNDHPEELNDLIFLIEDMLGKKALRIDKPLPAGDILETWAAIDRLQKVTGFAPKTSLNEGVKRFIDWYQSYHATGLK